MGRRRSGVAGLFDRRRHGGLARSVNNHRGVAALGTIAADHTQSLVAGGSGLPHALTAGYTLAWAIGAASVLAGVAVTAALLLRGPRRAVLAT
jgi:hypothetical protein